MITFDEKMLDDLAFKECPDKFAYDRDEKSIDIFVDAFKAGFRKADDIFVEFLSGLRSANVWEGTEWKYQRLWREAKKAKEE